MSNGIIGIIGNSLFLEPFYAGDHEHCAQISDMTKDDLIDRGIPVFPNYDYIEAHLYGISYEELLNRRVDWETQRLRDLEEHVSQEDNSELPF